MSGRISSPMWWLAVFTFLVSGIGVGLRANTARANTPIEDCLNAPKSVAPQGSHWYYRMDRAKLRKCWYLGAVEPAHHAAGQTAPRAAQATDLIALKKPAPVPAGAPVSITSDDSAPPLPHIKMLTVKLQPAPVSGGTTDQIAQQSAQEGDPGRSIPEITAVESSASSQTSAQAAGPAPAAATVRPDLPTVAPVKAQDPIAVPGETRTDTVRPTPDPGDVESTAQRAASTNAAAIAGSLTSVEMFSVWAFWLATVGVAFCIVMKIATARRRRIIIDRREFNWIGDRHQYEWCGDQQRHGCVAELDEFIDDVRPPILLAARDYSPTPLPQGDDEWSDNARAMDVASQSTDKISERRNTLAQLRRDLDELLRSRKIA